MSHMIADSTDELLNMVNLIGVNPKWIQYEGTWKEHFDISLSKRKLAIESGAFEITSRELVNILRKRRENEQ